MCYATLLAIQFDASLLHQIELLRAQKLALQSQVRGYSKATINVDATYGPADSPNRPCSSRIPLDRHSSTESTPNSYQAEDFPSTFASLGGEGEDADHEYLEQIVHLASKLRRTLLSGQPVSLAAEERKLVQDNTGLQEMLVQATPRPERADRYAHAFAKRRWGLEKG